MIVRHAALLVLVGTVLGCSSISRLELINDTNRSIFVRSKIRGLDRPQEWIGTVEAGERVSIWAGHLPLQSLSIEVDGKLHDYPPLPIPERLGRVTDDERSSWWRWTAEGPKFTAARLGNGQEMMLSYFLSLLAIVGSGMLIYKLARRDYIRRHS